MYVCCCQVFGLDLTEQVTVSLHYVTGLELTELRPWV